MDAALFAKMLSDPMLVHLKKLKYKYPQANLSEFIALLQDGFYRPLPLHDFHGNPVVYLENAAQLRLSAAKILLTPQNSAQLYGTQAMEREILSTFTIEQIDTSRSSVRRILSGYAPTNEREQRIYGMKRGLEFIADPSNKINEETIYQLYQMVIGAFLPKEDQLLPGQRYRHDHVYIVGDKLEHTGLPWNKLAGYMEQLVAFIQQDSSINDLWKAALIHFYLAYLHPYFDGNGRMARLLHLWYLVQQGYSSALFVPLSEYIERSRKKYYDAFSLVEQNARISGVLDVTPFLLYFTEEVYHKLRSEQPDRITTDTFRQALQNGKITEKEHALWQFVLTAYADQPFSTKQLEKDFGNAAYATIRGFVLKFTEFGLLRATKFSTRTKYQVVM
ncbi:cell filamentation protein Fic [Butyricicoccus pullicaecorum]|uniref:Cell filamentation protein Fic n=1 Tax=Butyricicoccus pullicaecorum TaxID=501571 RepID=A0A1Y4L837_9FIRM|nr:Fic family protein [Butyricicoccus pullicaecorum]OUP52908.1 cell filamentation protein Fic [Butyricicoccus pullicaecorum]